MIDAVDVAVVGGGVVGCAAALRIAQSGFSVVVLEASARIAEGVTSRNSGVIHSGLYYPPSSLKAASCVRGNALMYEWCASRGVWHRACGKLVVALGPSQLEGLERIYNTARESGAPGLSLLDAAAARALEPDVPSIAALHCERTGIVDPVELTRSFCVALEVQGGIVLTHARVRSIAPSADGWKLDSARGELVAQRVVNAAGLDCDDVARLAGIDRYRIHPCRGDYFRLKTQAAYRHLIYPVKDPAAPGLGVHLTLDRDGGYRLGPDAQYVASKDDFSGGAEKLRTFHAAAERLLGTLSVDQLSHDSCGIRPKLRGPADRDEMDFVLSEDAPGFINLIGIESPGLTASLDLADRVAAMCKEA